MSLINYFEKLFNEKDEKGYKTIYIMVDVHNTILFPTHDKEETFNYYKFAKETLKLLSDRSDVKLIMWTSSYPEKIKMYLKHFKDDGINFDFVNENPEYGNLDFACFDIKPFYDVGIDDKFGFDADRDWEELYNLLINM